MAMKMGKVVGNMISSRKYDGLQGYKLLLIELCYTEPKTYIVAADTIGAGLEQLVLVAEGSNIQQALTKPAPIDALVVGIIDSEPALPAAAPSSR
ncbi:EutN/CcmL family microcompartment protein [Paenibacillus thiaminolyticus]|nr:EutN/CcmL family microcompartment protein [Paenibacillus thiaminolyticus]